MNIWDIIILAVVAGGLILALRHMHQNKKKGCGCGCSECSQAFCPGKQDRANGTET